MKAGKERIDLNIFSFVWMRSCDRKQDDDVVWNKFEEFRLLIQRVKMAHRRAQRQKSQVGRLRGTLAQNENKQSNTPSIAILDVKPEASDLHELQERGKSAKRRYVYEVARSQLVLYQHSLADALEALGLFIDNNGLGLDKRHNVPISVEEASGAPNRLFKHNLGLALLFFQAGRKACNAIKDYLDRIPEFEAEIEKRFLAVCTLDFEQLITDRSLSLTSNEKPVRSLRIARYGSPSVELYDPILSETYVELSDRQSSS